MRFCRVSMRKGDKGKGAEGAGQAELTVTVTVRELPPGKEGGKHQGVRGSARRQDQGAEVLVATAWVRADRFETGPKTALGHSKAWISCNEGKPAKAQEEEQPVRWETDGREW